MTTKGYEIGAFRTRHTLRSNSLRRRYGSLDLGETALKTEGLDTGARLC